MGWFRRSRCSARRSADRCVEEPLEDLCPLSLHAGEDVPVHVESEARAGMAEAFGHDLDRDAGRRPTSPTDRSARIGLLTDLLTNQLERNMTEGCRPGLPVRHWPRTPSSQACEQGEDLRQHRHYPATDQRLGVRVPPSALRRCAGQRRSPVPEAASCTSWIGPTSKRSAPAEASTGWVVSGLARDEQALDSVASGARKHRKNRARTRIRTEDLLFTSRPWTVHTVRLRRL